MSLAPNLKDLCFVTFPFENIRTFVFSILTFNPHLLQYELSASNALSNCAGVSANMIVSSAYKRQKILRYTFSSFNKLEDNFVRPLYFSLRNDLKSFRNIAKSNGDRFSP